MTQIATNKDQSARLIACGLSYKTADMTLSFHNDNFYELMATPFHYGCFSEKDVPAWSLSALLALLPMEIRKDGIDFDMILKAYPNEEECYRWCIGYYSWELEATVYYSEAPDPIEACVRIVRTLTDNRYKLNHND